MLYTFEKLPIDRQESIMDAAASVFAEEGYHYARISKVCYMAGISNGALYKYFKNKEDLFHAVLDYGVKLIVSELYVKYTVNTSSLYSAIRDFLAGLVEFTEKHRDYISIYSDLGSSSMKRFAAVGSEKFESAASMYTSQLVEDSRKRGEIAGDIRSESAAYLIDNYITFFVYSLVSEYHQKRLESFYKTGDRKLSAEERIELIIVSLKQALGK
jgi:TetR/AcrR family transcriptional regulator